MPNPFDPENSQYTDSAPAKIILLGEHAVVYGEPAIAVPLIDRRVQTTIIQDRTIQTFMLESAELNVCYQYHQKSIPTIIEPLIQLFEELAQQYGIPLTHWKMTIQSAIPIGRGLGSGAAVSVSIIKTCSKAFRLNLSLEVISALAFDIEKVYHGKPSGIDNTVVTFEKPIRFCKGQPIQLIKPKRFHFVIADTGVFKSTRLVVEDVARARAVDPQRYDDIFHQIGQLTEAGKNALEQGDPFTLGSLMNNNHSLLQKLGVSSELLDTMVTASIQAGAVGAKLCGAGRGGCMIALLPDPSAEPAVMNALIDAGASLVFATSLQ